MTYAFLLHDNCASKNIDVLEFYLILFLTYFEFTLNKTRAVFVSNLMEVAKDIEFMWEFDFSGGRTVLR